jgi:hypothetical protein
MNGPPSSLERRHAQPPHESNLIGISLQRPSHPQIILLLSILSRSLLNTQPLLLHSIMPTIIRPTRILRPKTKTPNPPITRPQHQSFIRHIKSLRANITLPRSQRQNLLHDIALAGHLRSRGRENPTGCGVGIGFALGVDVVLANEGRAVSLHPPQIAVAVGEYDSSAVGCDG